MTPKQLRDANDSPCGRDPRDPEWQAREAARIFLAVFDRALNTRSSPMDFADYEDLSDVDLRTSCEAGDPTAHVVARMRNPPWLTDTIRLATAKTLLREAAKRLYTVPGAAGTYASIETFLNAPMAGEAK